MTATPAASGADVNTGTSETRADLISRIADFEVMWRDRPVNRQTGCGNRSAAARLPRQTLPQINQEAVSYMRTGDPLGAAAALTLLMRKCRTNRLTHRELAVARANLAAALLAAGLAEEALAEAEGLVAELEARPLGLLDAPAKRSLVRGLLYRGQALSALSRHNAAVATLERGLALDPHHPRMRTELDAAGRALLRQLLDGGYSETLALPPPEPRPLELSYAAGGGGGMAALPGYTTTGQADAATAVLQLQLRWEELLPARLMTPRTAEVDDRTRDTYNFVTIETDLRMPKRYLRVLHDKPRMGAIREAIQAAVASARRGGNSNGDASGVEDERDVRVLLLGSCAGLMGLVALRAGALHVTCVERWLYMASLAGEVLAGEGMAPDRYRVCYRRPTELRLREDVPICCNVVIATELLDDGLLTSGLLPAVRHAAAAGLITRDAVVVPATATVWLQAAQLSVPPPFMTGGLDLRAMDRYRWWPSHSLGAPMAEGAYEPLSDPKEAWHFDMLNSPDAIEVRTLDLDLQTSGRFNAVIYWYDVQLYGDIRLVTHQPPTPRHQRAPDPDTASSWYDSDYEDVAAEAEEAAEAGHRTTSMLAAAESPGTGALVAVGRGGHVGRSPTTYSVQPQTLQAAVHLLPGPIHVQAGDVLPLTVCHNTVSMRFEVLSADYQWLAVRDPSLPPALWGTLADTHRMAKFRKAIARAVGRLRSAGCPVVALDVGSGSGALALAAAAAGADSVVAAEVHPGLVAAARRCAAENGLGHKIVVVPGDVGELVRGQDLPYSGTNLIIFDLFDAGLLGHRVLPTLECVKRRLAGAAAQSWGLGTEESTNKQQAQNHQAEERHDYEKRDEEEEEEEERARQRQREQRVGVQSWRAGQAEVEKNSDNGGGGSGGGGSGGGGSGGGDSGCGGSGGGGSGGGDSGGGDSNRSNRGRVEVIPAAARVWVVGLEMLTRRVCGEDMSAVNKYRWDDTYESVRLQDIPYYRQLTVPVQVFNFDFTQPPEDVGVGAGLYGHGRTTYPSAARVEAEVIGKGVLNAVVFWFDLILDNHSGERISNAPPGIFPTAAAAATAAATAAAADNASWRSADGGGGCSDGAAAAASRRRYSRRSQALQYLDCALPVAPGSGSGGGSADVRTVVLQAHRSLTDIRFTLRPGVGVPVPRPPFKVEWGGGVSIENPHVQRARYCQLLVSEWLQRLPRLGGGGGAASASSIIADLAPLWRHCGSLALDAVALAEVTHRLTLLERLYGKVTAGGAGLGSDGKEVVAAVEGQTSVGLVRPEDVSRGLPAVWF